MQNETFTFIVSPEYSRYRLDRFLQAVLPSVLGDNEVSREKIKKSIRDGHCLLSGSPCIDPAYRLAPDQQIIFSPKVAPTTLEPDPSELNILYQDEHLAVINKPAGLTVHPAPSCHEKTLVHRLLAHFPALRDQEGLRPGIVHRLDRDTSGLICVALNEECRLRLSRSFAEREVHKEYLALVEGHPAPCGIVDAPIDRHPSSKIKMAVVKNGKPAKSEWRLLYAGPNLSLLAVKIYTGRTHQIRVHMAHLGFPLLGDPLYGRSCGRILPVFGASNFYPASDISSLAVPTRQMLHSWKLSFVHPFTGKSMSFTCPPPDDFLMICKEYCKRMYRVVLTGAAGSGKSLFVHTLESLGVPIWSADEALIGLYEPGGSAWQMVRKRFGDRFIANDASPVDRKKLAAALLPGPRGIPEIDIHELSEMVHPLLYGDLLDFWALQEKSGHNFAVAEVPLWFESGWGWRTGESQNSDEKPLVVGVCCDEEERVRRLLAVRGWSREMMDEMNSRQWSQDRKMASCDLVVRNNGTAEQLEGKAREFVLQMQQRRVDDERNFLAGLQTLIG